MVRLRSSDALEATFALDVGMTCCSLRYRGVELLGERLGLAAYAHEGVTMGMTLTHPWADRIASWSYTACGATVHLPISPLLHTDRWGLPVNGVQPRDHAWVLESTGAGQESAWLEATLPFDSDPRALELFPFPHRLRLRAEVSGNRLCIATTIEATSTVPVPACYGCRVYLRYAARAGATIVLPARLDIVTDERLLPTGETRPQGTSVSRPGLDELHEVFLLGIDHRLTLVSEERRLTVESTGGFPLAQVRSIASEPHVMVEALTAAPDALSRGAFPVARSGQPHRATLRLSVDELSHRDDELSQRDDELSHGNDTLNSV